MSFQLRVLSVLACSWIQLISFSPTAFAEGKTVENKIDSSARARLAKVASPERTTVIDMVIAAIDGEPITFTDLQNFIAEQGTTPPENLNAEDKEIRKQLRDLILAKLLEKEAQKAGISIGEPEIQAYIEEIKRQNNVDDAGLEAMLKSKGMSLKAYQVQIKNDILKNRIVGAEVRTKVSVSDADIERYVAAHPEMRNSQPADIEAEIPAAEGTTLHLVQILLRVPEDASEESREELRKQAEELHAKLEDGGDWSELGGEGFTDMGFVSAADLRDEVKDSVADLSEGETSKVIESPLGFQMVKLLEKKEPEENSAKKKEKVQESSEQQLALSDGEKQAVKNALFQERVKELLDKYLNDELPKKYSVEIKL